MAAWSGTGARDRTGRPRARPQAGDTVGPLPAATSPCAGCPSRAVPEAGLGAGLGLACPLCRYGDAASDRAAAPLWRRGRRGKQQDPRGQEEVERRPEPEPVFRAPLVLSKAGDVREEFENQPRQTADNMSDSENEEPMKRVSTRQWGLTANGKLSSNCSSRITRMLGANSEESRSWSTPVENNQIRRALPRSDSGTKATSLTLHTSTLNILSSSENSRPSSAPDLSTDKRPLTDASVSDPVKWERSTSPDSNDSISEELNHFKPIICSPCTPPKKLPDGRLLKPRVIRSTPRNLYSNLQKAVTTYEVSPHVLEKWSQILQDRHREKTACKGTFTSEEEDEEGTGRSVPVCHVPETEVATASRSCSSPGLGQVELQASPRPMDWSGFAEVPDSVLEDLEWESVECGARASPLRGQGAEQKENGAHQPPRRQTPTRARKRSHRRNVTDAMSGSGGMDSSSPRSNHSRKRHRKTKHTAAEVGKRPKLSPARGTGKASATVLTDVDRARQEDEDRKLAHRLQRRFDLERITVNRRKGSKDSYPLRTKVISNTE